MDRDLDKAVHLSTASFSLAGPTNADRARWAENALNVFGVETFAGNNFTDTVVEQPDTGGDAYTMVQDLITDLLHLARRHGWDPAVIMVKAQDAFDEECADER